MKKKTVFLLLWHLAVLSAIALCLLMFPEEMIEFKANLRRELNSAKNNIQISSFAELFLSFGSFSFFAYAIQRKKMNVKKREIYFFIPPIL